MVSEGTASGVVPRDIVGRGRGVEYGASWSLQRYLSTTRYAESVEYHAVVVAVRGVLILSWTRTWCAGDNFKRLVYEKYT